MTNILEDAELFALTAEPQMRLDLAPRALRTSLLDRPFLRRHRALTLPAMPAAWSVMVGGPYDLVITSSHACAKGFRPARRTRHLNYCYSPMRYVWFPELDVRGTRVPRAARSMLQRWDRHSAATVDSFAAISTAVRDRIRVAYAREARVIWPPCDTEFFSPGPVTGREGYLLAYSRFIPYKKLDLAIAAARECGRPIVVAGRGPMEAELRAQVRSGPSAELVLSPSDDELRSLIRGADAVVFPANEDFGIVPVEAQACGVPVVALGEGGSVDTVLDGRTGVLVDEQTVDAFAAGIDRLDGLELERGTIRRHAETFSTLAFHERFLAWVREDGGYPG